MKSKNQSIEIDIVICKLIYKWKFIGTLKGQYIHQCISRYRITRDDIKEDFITNSAIDYRNKIELSLEFIRT